MFYLYVMMVMYLLLMKSSVNANIMKILLQNKVSSWIICQTNYYEKLFIISAITVIIILICALIDVINAYFILFTVKADLITIILSAASIVINHLSRILCGYVMAGHEVRFISGIHCTSSTRPNFIYYDDDREGGALKFGVLAVAVEFLQFNVSSCVVLFLCVFRFVLFLCFVFLFCNVCMCLCFFILLGRTETYLFDFHLMLFLYGVTTMHVLSIISSVSINIDGLYFQTMHLSWIIWQINCYDNQLSSIQVVAAIIILCWAIIDMINAYCKLCNNDNGSNTSGNNKKNNYSNSNNNEKDDIITNSVTSNNSKKTNLKENNDHDVRKGNVANTVKISDASNCDETRINFATQPRGVVKQLYLILLVTLIYNDNHYDLVQNNKCQVYKQLQ